MSSTMPRSSQLSASLIAARQEYQTVLSMPMLRVPEFAIAMGISKATAAKWVKSGLVKGYRTGVSGRWRIPLTEVQRMKGLE
jgi:excisionase family DNA binding protein